MTLNCHLGLKDMQVQPDIALARRVTALNYDITKDIEVPVVAPSVDTEGEFLEKGNTDDDIPDIMIPEVDDSSSATKIILVDPSTMEETRYITQFKAK